MSAAIQSAVVSESSVGARLAGKYLTFRLGDEEYGLEILKVQEIIQLQNITRIPRTPNCVRGVINLRGKVIPVVDLRVKFELGSTEDTERTCIIVVQIRAGDALLVTGILIDEVREVLDIRAESIEEAPDFGSSVDTEFILGMGKVNGAVKILLDIDKVLTSDDLQSLRAATNRE